MKINIFEGARRITKLIAVIWVLGWCIYLFTWNPYINVNFRVDSPGSLPTRMSEQECDADDAKEFFYSKDTVKGTRFSGEFCFKSEVFDNGKRLIPIFVDSALTDSNRLGKWILANKDKKGTAEFERAISAYQFAKQAADEHKMQVRGFEKYSTEVSDYTKKVADNFKLSKVDEDWIDGEVWPARLKELKEGSLWIIGGVACLYIFTWCVGWIIRGFAGIPLGQDRKPDDI
ncbi:hypothetical protein [Methylomonas rivi]|uniref:Uncharacterized protein n=1 Tax=Methylomonas rivi TaxID=2952226 RepID=A0ABT1U8H2_9GAMM|nr:hypothetical protein [Methylomonas sp. WSC-6]MCQ8130153.1 hypothetical protein [Methylomonas sp. WSC-6]